MAANRPDFKTIRPYLPPLTTTPSLEWPTKVTTILDTLSKGPTQSGLTSGDPLITQITNLRNALSLSPRHRLADNALAGYVSFFDEWLPRESSRPFFKNIIPVMAKALLRFPALLEAHYASSSTIMHGGRKVECGLRMLESQQSGVVVLGQDLIAALLACSFFCMFPSAHRKAQGFQGSFNFDDLFAHLYARKRENYYNKIYCILHYFCRVFSKRPQGVVSFERKVLNSHPEVGLWAKSDAPLCGFEVRTEGRIEDYSEGNLEVDFADKFLGGFVLSWGCVQEEIRFCINPELIAGMLFIPCIADNEAVEIVGAERFSDYSGYNSTFEYNGDHVDKRGSDSMGRRNTRVLAIDALPRAGMRQYKGEFLLREVNKACCGFVMQGVYEKVEQGKVGVVTGNWGCGAFGGDPEVKAMIQWVAASQASRPFVSYHTFGLTSLKHLDEVCKRIVGEKWTVGDLWKKVAEYCGKKESGGVANVGFLSWVLPPEVKKKDISSKVAKLSLKERNSKIPGWYE